MTSTYSLRAQPQYMENHRATQPLSTRSGLAAVQANDGSAILLSIDDNNLLRVTVGVDGSQTGWSTSTISDELNAPAKSFAAGICNGNITILLATTATDGSGDSVQILTAPADVSADWLTDPSQRQWSTPASFASPSVPNVKAPYTVNALQVFPGAQIEAVATLLDSGNAVDAPFVATINGSAPSWTYLAPSQNYDTVLGYASGQASPTMPAGLYRLTTYQGGAPALSFQPTNTNFPTIDYTAPTGASVLAVLQVAPKQTALFVSGDAGIYLFTGNAPEGILLLQGSNTADASTLDIVTDGTTVSLWGLNGSRSMFYAQAPFASYDDPTQWTAPLMLMSGVSRAAAFISEQQGLTSLFAVSGAGNETESLAVLHKDPVTAGGNMPWTTRGVNLPDTNAYVTLDTYTTQVLVTDLSTNLPAAGVSVGVSASASCMIELNGNLYAVGTDPTAPTLVTTDLSGMITILHEAPNPAVANYTFAAPDGTQLNTDPTVNTRTTMATLNSTTALNQAQYPTTSGGWANLVNQSDQSAVSAVATGIQTVAGIQPASSPEAARRFAARRKALAAAHPSGLALDFDWGPLVYLGDLVQSVINDFENAVASIEQIATDTWALVVTIGNDIFHAIITTVEDVANAFVGLIQSIITDAEALFRFLAFLFEWGDILTVHTQLEAFYTAVLAQFPSVVGGLVGKVTTALGDAATTGNPQQYVSGASFNGTPNATVANQQPASTSVGGTDLQTSPTINWGKGQMGNISGPSSSTSVVRANDDPLPVFSVLAAALSTFEAQAISALSGMVDDTTSVVDGDISVGDWAGKVLQAMLTLTEDAACDVLNAIVTLLEDAVADIAAALSTPLDIPLFSTLYSDIAGGEQLTLLNLSCLLQAIPATIAYKLAVSNPDVATMLPAATISTMTQQIQQLADPASSSTRPLLSAMPGDDQSGAVEVIMGAIRIARGIAIIALTVEEGAGGGSPPSGLLTIDMLMRGALAVFDIADVCQQDDACVATYMSASAALIWPLAAAACLQLDPAVSGKGFASIDYAAASIIGLVRGIGTVYDSGCSECADILYAVTETTELGQHLLHSDLVAFAAAGALRAGACVMSGLIPILDVADPPSS